MPRPRPPPGPHVPAVDDGLAVAGPIGESVQRRSSWSGGRTRSSQPDAGFDAACQSLELRRVLQPGAVPQVGALDRSLVQRSVLARPPPPSARSGPASGGTGSSRGRDRRRGPSPAPRPTRAGAARRGRGPGLSTTTPGECDQRGSQLVVPCRMVSAAPSVSARRWYTPPGSSASSSTGPATSTPPLQQRLAVGGHCHLGDAAPGCRGGRGRCTPPPVPPGGSRRWPTRRRRRAAVVRRYSTSTPWPDGRRDHAGVLGLDGVDGGEHVDEGLVGGVAAEQVGDHAVGYPQDAAEQWPALVVNLDQTAPHQPGTGPQPVPGRRRTAATARPAAAPGPTVARRRVTSSLRKP